MGIEGDLRTNRHCRTSVVEIRSVQGSAAFDGAQLTREIILLRSPATAPEKELLVWLMW
jgi:hypothetical protein